MGVVERLRGQLLLPGAEMGRQRVPCGKRSMASVVYVVSSAAMRESDVRLHGSIDAVVAIDEDPTYRPRW
jgi:hypothetical protein